MDLLPNPGEARWTLVELKQLDRDLPYAVVRLQIGATDRSVRDLGVTVQVPLRDVRGKTVGELETFAITAAKGGIDALKFAPLLGHPAPG